jgi:hypothetical protein
MQASVFVATLISFTLALATPLRAQTSACTGNQDYSSAVTLGCTTIAGNLVIDGSTISMRTKGLLDLDGLDGLTLVDGDVIISYNPVLENIDGLANLDTVVGGLTIIGNDSLTNVDGLSGLTFLATSLIVEQNETLTNVDGLRSLGFLGRPVAIAFNTDLCDASVESLYRGLGIEVGLSPDVFAEENNGECVPAMLFASTLPSSRSVTIGGNASAYATMINAGAGVGYGCTLTLGSDIPAVLTSWETNPLTNETTSGENPSVNIAPGAFATWALRIISSAPISPTNVELGYECLNAPPADPLIGINTLLISATSKPTPDIVAIALTASGDGVLRIDGAGSAAAFATATVNVGLGGTITASARKSLDSAGPLNVMPLSLSICQTDPLSGACTSEIGPSVTTTIDSDDTPTFSIFATAEGSIPFDPATFRIFIEFTDSEGQVRGSSSVAVTTVPIIPGL